MLLHTTVSEVMAGSARKFLRVNRAIQLERSATAVRANEAQAPTAAAGGDGAETETIPESLQSIRHSNNLAVLYNATTGGPDYGCPPMLKGCARPSASALYLRSVYTTNTAFCGLKCHPLTCILLKLRLVVNSNPIAHEAQMRKGTPIGMPAHSRVISTAFFSP